MNQLKERLKKHEGLRLYPYKCFAGKTTIGYGRNIEDNGISNDEAEMLLDNDINCVVAQLNSKFKWFKDLPEIPKEVLINMDFNLGITRLSKFKKTLKHFEDRDFESASVEMLDSKWAEQVGKRAIELSNLLKNFKSGWHPKIGDVFTTLGSGSGLRETLTIVDIKDNDISVKRAKKPTLLELIKNLFRS